MIEIISGTDRPNSKSSEVAKFILDLYRELGTEVGLIDLSHLSLGDVAGGDYWKGARGDYAQAVNRITSADGVVVVCPEYNGSFPGALKLFIDYWKYPETFEHRPIALVGLGNRWGGLRPVEHLQQVFGYRNAFIFPQRVFLQNIKEAFRDGRVMDPFMHDLLKNQARDFLNFIKALKSEKLDAMSRLSLS